jgi:type III restriction enzyme
MTRDYCAQPTCEAPPHALFPQVAAIVRRYLDEKIQPLPPADILDVFLSPYYGWVIETLLGAIKPDAAAGETPEIPRYERLRPPGSTADVDFWTSREPREVLNSHVNYIVPDTKVWEQAAAFVIDKHPLTDAFVKNAGLGFAIPYLHNGEPHDYVPDFIVRLKTANGDSPRHLILEVKGFDRLKEVKQQAAARWVAAVNADGSFGPWAFRMLNAVTDVAAAIQAAAGGRDRSLSGGTDPLP